MSSSVTRIALMPSSDSGGWLGSESPGPNAKSTPALMRYPSTLKNASDGSGGSTIHNSDGWNFVTRDIPFSFENSYTFQARRPFCGKPACKVLGAGCGWQRFSLPPAEAGGPFGSREVATCRNPARHPGSSPPSGRRGSWISTSLPGCRRL